MKLRQREEEEESEDEERKKGEEGGREGGGLCEPARRTHSANRTCCTGSVSLVRVLVWYRHTDARLSVRVTVEGEPPLL